MFLLSLFGEVIIAISYKPTDKEIKSVIRKLNYRLRKYNYPTFKIGRIDASTPEQVFGLKNREEYKNCEDIYVLYDGSKGKCKTMEKIVIKYARRRYEQLCLNSKLGGGRQGKGDYHMVYIVIW